MLAPSDRYHGKKIAVLGLGTSGRTAAALARRMGAQVTVLDSGEGDHLPAKAQALRDEGYEAVTGPDAVRVTDDFDLAVLSPGIDPSWPLARAVTDRGIPAVSEIEFAWQNASRPSIAITGTNGKTTTTELTAALLNGAGLRTVPCGNYGVALSEVVLEDAPLDLYTIEVSSFQLELISTFRPEVAVWMNFAPDHLDRHPSLEAYRAAKLRIFENQTEDDFAVLNGAEEYPAIKAAPLTFSAWRQDAEYYWQAGKLFHRGECIADMAKTNLRGLHNAENVMAAMAAVHARGVPFDAMQETLRTYYPPRHRCELAATVNGVEFLNDSKATNIHAMESALRGQEQPVILIAGGKDKGLDYGPAAALIAAKTLRVFTIGEIRQQLAAIWGPHCETTPCSSLEEAVRLAAASAQPGQTVLFAPGTSSFDMFTGYAHRGDVFCELVKKLTDQP